MDSDSEIMDDDAELIATALFDIYKDIYPYLKFNEVLKITQKFLDPNEELSDDVVRDIAKSSKPYYRRINALREAKHKDEISKSKKPKLAANEVPPTNNILEVPKLEPSLVFKNACVLIDSKDRDINEFIAHNPFTIHFGEAPSSRTLLGKRHKPSINRKFTDIHMLSIKQVIIPTTTDDMPYLVLQIPELGSNLNGNNDIISGSFGYLSNGISKGGYIVFSFDKNDEHAHMSKIFNPRVEISRLTFIIKKPDGSNLEFDDTSKSIVIELDVTIMHKEFDNNSFNVPNS